MNDSLKRCALTALCLCSEDMPDFYKLCDFDSPKTIGDLIHGFGERYSKYATVFLEYILVTGKAENGGPLLFSHIEMPNRLYRQTYQRSAIGKKEIYENMAKSRYHEPNDMEMSMRIPRRNKDLAEIDSKIKNYTMIQDKSTFIGQFVNRGPKEEPGLLQNFMQCVGIIQPEPEEKIQNHSYQRILDFSTNQGYHTNQGQPDQYKLGTQDLNMITPQKQFNPMTFGSNSI